MVCACVHVPVHVLVHVCVYMCICTHAHFHWKETLKSRSEILIELTQFDLADNVGKGIPDKGTGTGRSI